MKIFGNSTHLEIIILFYNNPGYLTNITKLADTLDKCPKTVMKVVSDLIEAGLLSETDIGRSKMIKVNENNPYTQVLFNFISFMRGNH